MFEDRWEPRMSRRTGLILDFGGVLTTSIAACARGFDRRTGLPEGTFLSFLGRDPEGAALWADLERGAVDQAAWSARTAQLLGIDGTDLLARVLADLRPEESVLAAARAAAAAGIRVGILSNSLGAGPYDVYAGYGLDEFCHAVLLSEQHRMRKPDPEIYTAMLDLMELPGEACVFVDDTPRNLPPAEELGIATVLARDPAATIAQVEALLEVPLTGQLRTA